MTEPGSDARDHHEHGDDHHEHGDDHHEHGDDHHEHGSHGPGDAAGWDARYAAAGLIWGAGPNRYVARYTADLPPGRAVDLACGEGRNAIYLARAGWQVTGVDFSAVAIDKARRLERSPGDGASHEPIDWVCADLADYRPEPVDLAMLVFAHLPPRIRRTVLRQACAALRPGGRILVVGHHRRNLTEGVGGPQDPDILFTPTDVIDDLGAVAPDLLVEIAVEPLREVSGADRPAIDTVVLARRP